MDYDRYDAFLHHIFKQTQGDSWFRPNEDVSAGVCLRIDNGGFRVFPYENLSLEPFETAVTALNPAVAVKVRSAAVHAALAEVQADERSIYVDANTRIQILNTMMLLPNADKEQSAAFIRDERVLVVWSDSLDSIIPICRDFEDRLIKLLWRSRPGGGNSSTAPSNGSVSGHSGPQDGAGTVAGLNSARESAGTTMALRDVEKSGSDISEPEVKWKRTWYGKKIKVTRMVDEPEKRPVRLYAAIYNGLAAALVFIFIGNGVKIVLMEWELDGQHVRFALYLLLPFLFCVALFFAMQIIQNVTMAIGPIEHYHENSKYYSARKPKPNKIVDNNLPHVTIQMPVYRESLDVVLTPSIESLKKAMQTYARQGGTSTIFINDDGLRLLPSYERDRRIAFYANHGIGWVARPKHDDSQDGFKRTGRFKKASNMNYGLSLSLKAEKHLEKLQRQQISQTNPSTGHTPYEGPYGMQYQHLDGEEQGAIEGGDEDLEEKALGMAIEEVFAESGSRFRPWAANGKAIRLGEIVLLVDSDTLVPEDCLRDAAREMAECPTVAIIQHASDVMQVANHYFENGIAYFTRRINKCISMTCANGEVAPFVGHNSFLRWKAIQDAAFVDADGQEKIWSETNVSEDFDMSLRLQMRGYIIRWATYANGDFKEGVSLTIDDELNRWMKYAYGCNELLFNPLIQWWRKGPIARQIHRFIWSNAPLHYKISMLSYMFSYYGIAASVTIGIINYVLLGFQLPVDGFYMHSFEIWLASMVVFFGSGNVGFALLEYRLGQKNLLSAFLENLMWSPFFFFFFGGLSIPLSQAILAHLFSYNISWQATKKEVERSNFFKEVPKIFKRFWFSLLLSILILAAMVVISTPLVPLEWRITGAGWAVILPLAITLGCHILFPIILNPWLMIFSY